jgi:hypothetical protein
MLRKIRLGIYSKASRKDLELLPELVAFQMTNRLAERFLAKLTKIAETVDVSNPPRVRDAQFSRHWP